jgi:hypothetical protein
MGYRGDAMKKIRNAFVAAAVIGASRPLKRLDDSSLLRRTAHDALVIFANHPEQTTGTKIRGRSDLLLSRDKSCPAIRHGGLENVAKLSELLSR